MRHRFQRISCVLYLCGNLLSILGVLILVPLVVVLCCWGDKGEGGRTLSAFLVPAAGCFLGGITLRSIFSFDSLDTTGSMLFCALGWLLASAVGAIPFTIGIHSSYLDGYFEAMSGFTTTGITVFSGLDDMPASIIFWRAFTQWIGGVGILSFFLAITFRGVGAHHILGAESHKISSGRPVAGLANTVKILWGIYGLFTVLSTLTLALLGMSFFDAMCHSFTALSTGGFAPYDSSIDHYRVAGHANYILIEYALTFFMMLGGINFLVHYRVLTRDVKALWDNIEMRWWWGLIAGFTLIIMFDHLGKTGAMGELLSAEKSVDWGLLERTFRYTIFQVVSVLTTTGFGTMDIGASYFPALSKQLFIVMMVIGGCVGSTGGGIKVLRVAILNRLMVREVRKLRVSAHTSTGLIVDKKPVPDDEAHRVSALFFAWIALLVFGGAVTALLSDHGAFASFSGMCSALGNIGPCYISVPDMIHIHPVVKITYILGMLAGRLEILPVLVLFSRRAWR